MSIAVLEKQQENLEKQVKKAEKIFFGNDFSKDALRRTDELNKKYILKVTPSQRKRIHIRLEENPKKIIAWAIAQRIKEAREKKGLSQDNLAEKTGIARPNIARLEGGRHIPTLSTLQKIAEALTLNINYLMAEPAVTQKVEFKEMAEMGLDEWQERLGKEDKAV